MSVAKSPSSLVFKVHRHRAEFLAPAKPTPHEFKKLSDLDTLDYARIHVTGLSVYAPNPSMHGADPVQIIRKAVSKALVFYYPWAGRLREAPSGELTLECTGQGILFIEADADVTLEQFGSPRFPPFPCLDQLVDKIPGSSEIVNTPLLLIQVTRLKCGSFIIGAHYNHVISDAFGFHQFLFAIGEMARGANSPSVLPVWERHVLTSRNPQLTSSLPQNKKEIIEEDKDKKLIIKKDLCRRTFFFEPSDISALRAQIPPYNPRYSSMEIVKSCIWKCRVVALQPRLTDEMSLIWAVNLRHRKHKHFIPTGYYGNAVVFAVATSTAKEIIENSLSYTLQLMRKAEEKVMEDYSLSPSSVMVNMGSYTVSDLRYAGFGTEDFGWGKPVFAGPDCYALPISGFQMPYKTEKGENGVMLPMCLPNAVMERFEKELKYMLNGKIFIRDENVVQSKL